MNKKTYTIIVLLFFSIFFLPLISPVSATFAIPTIGDFIVFVFFRLASSLYIFSLFIKYILKDKKNWWPIVNMLPAILIPSFLVVLIIFISGDVDIKEIMGIFVVLLLTVTLPFMILDFLLRFGRAGKIIVAAVLIIILIISNTGLAFSMRSLIDERLQRTGIN